MLRPRRIRSSRSSAWTLLHCSSTFASSHRSLPSFSGTAPARKQVRLRPPCQRASSSTTTTCVQATCIAQIDARLFLAVYWTLCDFPQWLRAGDFGWSPLCVIPKKWVPKVKGGLSAIMAALLEVFWPAEGWNFDRTGLRLPGGSAPVGGSAPIMWFRAVFAGFLADEKPLAETADAKGASGHKPCPWCSNVVGRCRPDEVRAEGLVHYVCSAFERLRPWTAETLQAACDRPT